MKQQSITHEGGPIYPSVEALAIELGLGRQSVYEALRSGDIPCIRIGRRFVLPRAAIQAWLQNAGVPKRFA